jgi:hypothetical protein
MPSQAGELKVRGVTIKLHRAGKGRTARFLCGARGVPQWLPFFDALAKRCELLVPEHPGFGGSNETRRGSAQSRTSQSFEMLVRPGYTSIRSMN